ENRDNVRAQLGAHLARSVVVHNPFSVPHERTLPWPQSTDPIRLACVARLEFQSKGQDVLLRVLSAEKWRSRALEVNLFGAGPCQTSIERSIRNRALKNVHLMGHVSDIAGVWAEHHALILPSRYEGTPLALQEAMLCGRPAIVTDAGGNCDLLDDNVTGFIAGAATPALLDEAMERAWARRAEWKAIGERAAV